MRPGPAKRLAYERAVRRQADELLDADRHENEQLAAKVEREARRTVKQ